MAKLKVLILFGGTSVGNEHSIRSAAAVIRTLSDEKYELVPLGISKKGRWLYFPGDISEIENGCWEQNPDCSPAILSPDPAHRGILVLEDDTYSLKRIDIIFSLLHGDHGEDGAIQGLCELSNIPYIGNGILSSAICRNKAMTHQVLNASGIRTPKWYAVQQRDLNRLDAKCEDVEHALSYPMFVKPSSANAAKGTAVAHSREELQKAIKLAFTQDTTVLVEQLVEGRELRIAVFGYDMPFASFVGEIIKDETGADKFIVPTEIDDTTHSIIREIAIQAFSALECHELALFDFFYAANGEILLGEVNTIPSLSEQDAYPLLMNDLGMRYSYLLDKLIEQALEHAERDF
ncbi:MAG: D-alanine--D-alanine ligase [Oscillospiraceae bacterium]|nr:D-alanine--D-alanine ligase [Oscillospiraceae bacterium]